MYLIMRLTCRSLPDEESSVDDFLKDEFDEFLEKSKVWYLVKKSNVK